MIFIIALRENSQRSYLQLIIDLLSINWLFIEDQHCPTIQLNAQNFFPRAGNQELESMEEVESGKI